jgi:maltooligosyltrehalose trehalohydrolase
MENTGAQLIDGTAHFKVWASATEQLSLEIVQPESKTYPMERDQQGYFRLSIPRASTALRYFFRFPDGRRRPDPASAFQPDGVHQASALVDHQAFSWDDRDWTGIPLSRLIMYELHVGTFTPEGTFEAAARKIPDLLEMGINAVEIMPVAQFPGDRNWGYDGVHPFAVQNSYGGPDGLKSFVNACHTQGMAVFLDVVYNHLGPEGNYLGEFGPYFTDRYVTPWGRPINFDGPDSDHVRAYFRQNALYWLKHFHIDGLRLDAIHSYFDFGAHHFLRELADAVKELSMRKGRRFLLIAESNLNDVRVINPPEKGGHGIDAQWCDDFHHALHTLLTGENDGYYEDYGNPGHLTKCLNEGFVYSWEYSPYRRRLFGSSSRDNDGHQFVISVQNHDQIGNRPNGERLGSLTGFDGLKLAAGVMFVSAYVPMLFMGEEFADPAPFLYFVSHGDEALIHAVRAGRRQEFQRFKLAGEAPDPQSPETFLRSKLSWDLAQTGKHKILRDFYAQLIRLRRSLPALAHLEKKRLRAWNIEDSQVIFLHRWDEGSQVFVCLNFGEGDRIVPAGQPQGTWRKRLDSCDGQWAGPGAVLPDILTTDQEITVPARSFALYELQEPL